MEKNAYDTIVKKKTGTLYVYFISVFMHMCTYQ